MAIRKKVAFTGSAGTALDVTHAITSIVVDKDSHMVILTIQKGNEVYFRRITMELCEDIGFINFEKIAPIL